MGLSNLEDGKSRDDDKTQKRATTLRNRLGLEEFISLQAWRESFAELVGSAALIFTINTMVIGTIESEPPTPNLILSVLVAIIVIIMFLSVFPVSGGHLNPAISFTCALMGLISMSRAVIYTIAQSVGAVLATLALQAVVSSEIADHFSLGGCTLSVIAPGSDGPTIIGIGTSQGLWIEILSIFVILFAVGSIGFNRKRSLGTGPIFLVCVIGILVGMMTYVTTTVTKVKGYAGAGMNPARCIGPALIRGGHLWDRHWVFWLGPAIGVLAFYIYTKIVPSQHFHAGHD